MFAAYIIVTVLAAAANLYAATNDFTRPQWLLANMTKVGVPESWLTPLGVLKAAGAVGLLVGIGVPWIGTAAAVGLTLFFVGGTHYSPPRTRLLVWEWGTSHVPHPRSGRAAVRAICQTNPGIQPAG